MEDPILRYVERVRSASDPAAIASAITAATEQPGLHHFAELLVEQGVEKLRGTEHAAAVDVLELLSRGNYREWVAAGGPTLTRQQETKLRVLSVISAVMGRREVAYSALVAAADVPLAELDRFLVAECLYSGAVSGTLDAAGGVLIVEGWDDRDGDPHELSSVLTGLDAWLARARASAASLRAAACRVRLEGRPPASGEGAGGGGAGRGPGARDDRAGRGNCVGSIQRREGGPGVGPGASGLGAGADGRDASRSGDWPAGDSGGRLAGGGAAFPLGSGASDPARPLGLGGSAFGLAPAAGPAVPAYAADRDLPGDGDGAARDGDGAAPGPSGGHVPPRASAEGESSWRSVVPHAGDRSEDESGEGPDSVAWRSDDAGGREAADWDWTEPYEEGSEGGTEDGAGREEEAWEVGRQGRVSEATGPELSSGAADGCASSPDAWAPGGSAVDPAAGPGRGTARVLSSPPGASPGPVDSGPGLHKGKRQRQGGRK